jgi:hypothetical protein
MGGHKRQVAVARALEDDVRACKRRCQREDVSKSTLCRRLKAIKMSPHIVDNNAMSKTFALAQWAPAKHLGLFLITMVFRAIIATSEKLDATLHCVKINGRRLEQCYFMGCFA